MRYLILVLLNLPVIFLAFLNILTQYKLKTISKARFRRQILLWLAILVVLIGSFPAYNMLTSKSLFDSNELTLFDIFQTTAIIYLIYIINHQRQKIEKSEKFVRDLHQELSIRLSSGRDRPQQH